MTDEESRRVVYVTIRDIDGDFVGEGDTLEEAWASIDKAVQSKAFTVSPGQYGEGKEMMGILHKCDCESKPEIRQTCKCVKADCDAMDLAKRITIEVEIKRLTRWRWRVTLACWLMSFASWLGSFGKVVFIGEIEGEPWLYYCPHCKRDFNGAKPDRPLTMVVTCPHCSYQSLVGGSVERPYIVNPDRLQEGVELCSYGCHYEEPYGFVPMAGCPVHD